MCDFILNSYICINNVGNESKVKKKEMDLIEIERLRSLYALFSVFRGLGRSKKKRDLKKAHCWLSPLLFVHSS